MPKQFHVQAIETTVDGHAPARELLPWADPYIASLMGRLHNEADEDAWDFEAKDEDFDDEDADFLDDELPEDWHLDRQPALPPVYGGWPLLNDLPTESRHEVA